MDYDIVKGGQYMFEIKRFHAFHGQSLSRLHVLENWTEGTAQIPFFAFIPSNSTAPIRNMSMRLTSLGRGSGTRVLWQD